MFDLGLILFIVQIFFTTALEQKVLQNEAVEIFVEYSAFANHIKSSHKTRDWD